MELMESVWDYPRPPRLESTQRHISVRHAGVRIADTRRALRVSATSHPPVYYLPPADVDFAFLQAAPGTSSCEWKGVARYWDVIVEGELIERAAWSYAAPDPAYEALEDHLAFYADRLDDCRVDGERVRPQPGLFYGGWITADLQGPFKGEPGSMGW